MSMRAVELNHACAPKHDPWPARALLVAGCLASIGLGMALHDIDAKTAMLEADASRLRHPRQETRQSEAEAALQRTEIAAVQTAMAELALPWEQLFRALESTRTPRVKLLAMEPNPRQRKLRISAAASDTQDILDYIQALDRQSMLEDVFLLRQERDDDGNFIFSVDAVWNVKP
ncbi:hypothetical protein [Methylobacillus sp. MM3]|uniref:hypothetical protein n=1 Tax=Methylobacillus sp. MM3 TaxID=1848039 RepID=UPI0010420BC0|nr:hypothetical protein [Methylobacillus sp. MM3]